MLNKVKTALRLTTTAYDEELQDLINACKADLGLTDIYTIKDDDVLIIRCVIIYCKMYFGTPNDMDSKRLKQAYDELKGSMLMSSKYTDWQGQGGGDMVIDKTLSKTSENAVQNKVITVALENAVSLITANTNSIATINENINAVNAELTSIQGSIANVEQSITNINDDIASINTEVTGVKDDVASVNESVGTLNTDVSLLKANETQINSDIADLKLDVANNKDNIHALDQSNINLLTKMGQVENKLTNGFTLGSGTGGQTTLSPQGVTIGEDGTGRLEDGLISLGYDGFAVDTNNGTVILSSDVKTAFINALGFTGETMIKGWTAITPNTYSRLDISQAIAEGKKRFTILIYAKKSTNRQAIKYELTLTELEKLLSKATTNELTITRSCAGITNANNIALCKQGVKRVYDGDVALEGVLDIKYQIYEGGNAVTGLDNFECCVYAE